VNYTPLNHNSPKQCSFTCSCRRKRLDWF